MKERVENILIEVAAWIGALLFYGGVALLLFGCKSVQYIPLETVRTECVTVHDSIYIENTVHDSTITFTKGDTVLIEHWHDRWRERWRDRWRDSIRVDSVQVSVPVERKLTKWETFCIDYGKIMLGCMIAFIVILLFVIIRWFTNKKK